MKLYAAIKKLSVAPDRKLIWLKTTIVLAMGSGFILSPRLWVSSRLFPLSPISESLPAIPFPLDYVWFFILLGLLLGIAIIAQPRRWIITFLVLAGLLSLLDQARWQPWFYQYFSMLAAVGVHAWKRPEAKTNRAALDACRLIVACTYFWSGLQKLNVNFVLETWPDMTGALLRALSISAQRIPFFLILLIPLLEMCTGLGLLARKFRNVSAMLAISMHLAILILLIFSGENTVVWPWNVAMIFFVIALFWQDTKTSLRNILVAKNAFHALIFLLFGVLPALSLIGLWDSYLSSALYSGNTNQAVIYVSPSVVERLPAALRPHVWQNSEPFFLDVNRWAYGELNVPVYPEPRIYRRIAEQVCAYVGESSDIKLRIKWKPDPLTGQRDSTYYDCQHLH